MKKYIEANYGISVFEAGSRDYKKLKLAADMLNDLEDEQGISRYVNYHVDETYFDYGQDWMWTTIIADSKSGHSVQVLSPRDQESILFSSSTRELLDVVEEIYDDLSN